MLCMLPGVSFAEVIFSHFKMRHQIFLGGIAFSSCVAALNIAAAFSVVEYTPALFAKDHYKGEGTIQLFNGGVPNLFSNSTIDLATNAETQALRNYNTHKNLRIIYTVAEVAYRLTAKKSIAKLTDLKGRRVGAIPSTSSAYFVERLLVNAGLSSSDYTLVFGNGCFASPCAPGTLPAMLKNGSVDAIGFWEPTIQLAIDEIGADQVSVFQDAKVYREIFNLHTTAEKLADPKSRKNIVELIRALDFVLPTFQNEPDKVIPTVAEKVGTDAKVLKEAWPVHKWNGTIPSDLIDVLVEEDKYLANVEKREAMSREVLEPLVDWSVLKEARNGTI